MTLNKKKIIITTSVALVIVVAAMAVGALLGSHNSVKQISHDADSVYVNSPKRRFALPDGYKKVEVDRGSFAAFLRHLPLKPYGADLHLWDGEVIEKGYDGGIVDLDFGHKDAEQCADAVIYLRAL